MRLPLLAGALVVVALVASACVAEPGASADPSASASAAPSASADASASPAAKKVLCPTPLPLDPSTGAMVTTIEALAALGEDAAPCYGTAKLQVRAYVPQIVGLGGIPGYVGMPAWLYGTAAGTVLASGRGVDSPYGDTTITVYSPPSLGPCDLSGAPSGCAFAPYIESWVTVVGHYNDPASSTCSATPTDVEPTPPAIPAQESELTCLRRFVVDSVAPFAIPGPLPQVDPGLCPVEPITVDQLVEGTTNIGPQYGLGCLGAQPITFTAYVVPGVGLLSGMEQTTVEPRWLADPLNTGIVLADDATAGADATNWLVARVPPDLPPAGEQYHGFSDVACDGSAVDPASCPFAPFVGGYVTVTGHYDDPESLTCREVPAAGGEPLLDPAVLILSCREQLVITSVSAASGPGPGGTPDATATPPTTSTH